MTRRILIIEDNADLAFGLQHNLEFEGYDVETATTGKEGLNAILTGRFDLVVLDLGLPDVSGFQVLEQLSAGSPRDQVPVLVLTARDNELDKVRGLRMGADDYMTKPFRVLELVARVEAILRRSRPGHTSAADGVIEFGDVVVRPGQRVVERAGVEVNLTPREFDLLLALLSHRGDAVSRLDLLRRVWGHKSAVETRTVDTHVSELRRKLESDPTHPSHILTVRKVGYRLKT